MGFPLARFWCVGAVAAFVLAGCGDKGDGGKGISLKATSPEQALSMLPAKERQSFDAWKSRLVKSCTAEDIFDGRADMPAIDSGLFAGAVGPAFLLTGESGEFAVVGLGNPLTGFQTTERKSSVTENDRVVAGLEAETKREGSHCVVTLFGQKVAEAQLWESVPVTAHYQVHKAKDGANVETLATPLPLSRVGFRGVDVTPYLQPVLKAIAPNASSREFVAKKLALPPGSAARLIRLSTVPLEAAVWSPTFSDTPAFSPRFPLWMGSESVLAAHTGGEQEFEWALDSHGANVTRFRVAVKYTVSSDGSGKSSLRSLSLGGSLSRSPVLAADCFVRRLRLARMLKYEAPRLASPSIAEVSGPCRVLTPNFSDALVAVPEARRAFVNTFAELPPSKAINYGDWDAALIFIATRLNEQGRDFAAELNPEGNSTVLQEASAFYRPFALSIKGTDAEFLGKDLLAASLHWALRGEGPSKQTQERLLEAVKVSGAAFPESMRALLGSLSHAPYQHGKIIDYAASLKTDFLASVKSARQKLASLGLGSWSSEKLGRALQDRIEPIVVAGWHATLEPAAAFTAREKTRKLGFSHETNRVQVMKLAMEEGWDQNAFTLFESILTTAPRPSACSYQTDLSSVAGCIGLGKFSRKEKGMLSPELGARYADTAALFNQHLASFEKSNSMLKYSVPTVFWEPVWKRCSNADAYKKTKELDAAAKALVAETNSIKKFDWERKIREAWRDCN